MRYLIRSASLTGFAAVARSVGLDPASMLPSVGLEPSVLQDPDLRIPVDAVRTLLESSARASGAEDFGLRMALTRNLSNLGPLGLVVREEPTLRAMLDTLARYVRLHNESLFFRVDQTGGVVVISQELFVGRPMPVRQSVELSIGMLHRSLNALLGGQWHPLRVCFRHDAPAKLATHHRVFGGTPVQFDADFDGVVCRASDLERPLPAADPVLARYGRQYLDSLAAPADATPRDRVRQLVRLLLPSGRCTIEQVAQHLGVDRRTIHRQLARNGCTFSGLVDDVREEIVTGVLASPRRPLADVSELLGFSAQSAFSRWFRARFGCSATQWRERVR